MSRLQSMRKQRQDFREVHRKLSSDDFELV